MANNVFGNLKSDGLEEQQDRLGGGSFILDTDVYPAKVNYAYAQKSNSSDAMSLVCSFEVTKPDGSTSEYRETFWVSNRNGENFYADKQDKNKKHPLPGFAMADALCFLTTGYGLADQDMDERVWKVYDFEQKKEVERNLPTLVDVVGQPITLAILKELHNKQEKDSGGTYVDVAGTVEKNQIDKMFHTESGRTLSEIKAEIEEPVFMPKWLEKNKGKPPRDRRSIKTDDAGGGGAGSGSPKGAPPANQKPKTSLFGKK